MTSSISGITWRLRRDRIETGNGPFPQRPPGVGDTPGYSAKIARTIKKGNSPKAPG